MFKRLGAWIAVQLELFTLWRQRRTYQKEIWRLEEIRYEIDSIHRHLYDHEGEVRTEALIAQEASEQIGLSVRSLRKEMHLVDLKKAKIRLAKLRTAAK